MGVIDRNPWRDMETTNTYTPRTVVWSEEEVRLMIATALDMGYKHVAIGIALMYDTAQRPGDVLKWRYKDVYKDEQGYFIVTTTEKTGAKVKPALTETSTRLLEGLGNRGETALDEYLVSPTCRLRDFRYIYRLVQTKAGIRQELQLRDIRRTAITEMGGASDDLILSVTGHSDRKMLNIYSQKDRQKALEAQNIRNETRHSRLREKFELEGRDKQEDGLSCMSG
jgi:integrase